MAEVARSHGLQVEIGSFEKWNAGGDGGAGTIAHLEGTGRFTKPEVRTYLWEQRYSRDEWLDQLPTHSDHRPLPPEKLAAGLTAVAHEIDAAGGSLVGHYDAKVRTALR